MLHEDLATGTRRGTSPTASRPATSTDRLSDPDKRAVLLELLERTEREPDVIGATSHLLVVARK